MKKEFFEQMLGPSNYFNSSDTQKQKLPFFKPYQSKTDLAFKSANIITAPVMCAGLSLALALQAISKISHALINLLLKFDTKSASAKLTSSGLDAGMSLLLLIAAVVTPILNTVSLIGSSINTLRGEAKTSSQPEPTQSPLIH